MRVIFGVDDIAILYEIMQLGITFQKSSSIRNAMDKSTENSQDLLIENKQINMFLQMNPG
jgi:hypothetical protein